VDRYGSNRIGHYRGWIVGTQILLVACLVAISFFPAPEHFGLLLVLFSFTAFFSSTQDVATDALAVRVLKPDERGAGNSVQATGNLMGGMLGGGLILIIYDTLGWQTCLLALAACTALPLVSVMRFREPPKRPMKNAGFAGFNALLRFFRRPGILHWICILLAFRSVGMIVYSMINPMLVDLGWELGKIGMAAYLFGPMFGLLGVAVAGWTISRIGRKPTVQLGMIFTILAVLGMFLPLNGFDENAFVYTVIGLLNSAYGFGSTVLYTVVMDKCHRQSAGTDFSLQMALTNGAMMVSAGIALQIAEIVGYSGVLAGCAGMAVLFMALIQVYGGFEGEQEKSRVAMSLPE